MSEFTLLILRTGEKPNRVCVWNVCRNYSEHGNRSTIVATTRRGQRFFGNKVIRKSVERTAIATAETS